MAIGDTNGWDAATALIVGIPALAAALFAFLASRRAKETHREVKSPNGRMTGDTIDALAQQQDLMAGEMRMASTHRAEIQKWLLDLAEMFHAHTAADDFHFATVGEKVDHVLTNQEQVAADLAKMQRKGRRRASDPPDFDGSDRRTGG